MGRKIDALLGRKRFIDSSKLKPLLNLSLFRLSVLKSRCHVRRSQARSDALQLLQLGHHERALLRVELVLKEENLLDVYVMVESYCNLLIERIDLLERQRECPDELKEAISGLLFASSRCGDFPELLQIRTVFASHFGKEFVARPMELRNSCSVNPTMIQKLSTKQQNLETRMTILKEIALENNISLQLDEDSQDPSREFKQTQIDELRRSGLENFSEGTAGEEEYSGSVKARKKYKDVADAAQAAFESAAYAAEAARAAVELSRSESQDPDSRVKEDDHGITAIEAKQNEGSEETNLIVSPSNSKAEDGTKTGKRSMNRKKSFDESDDDDDEDDDDI